MKTKDARSLSSQAQEALRMRAVEAVQNGMSQGEAAELFGVARQTVCNWCVMWKSDGMKALRSDHQAGTCYGKKGKNSGCEGNRKALFMQHDIHDHKPRDTPLHGFQG